MPEFSPIVFVHGWGGVGDLFRDFDDRDERDPYAGWNEGRRYNDPEGWIKFRDSQMNFEGLVLRMVKEFNYYDAANDEDLEEFKRFLGDPGQDVPLPDVGPRDAALHKSLWIFRYYEYNAQHLQLSPAVERELAKELKVRGYRGKCEGIPRYAALLALRIQQITCPECRSMQDFKARKGLNLKQVCLVGHSMGGLIARFAVQYNLYDVAPHVKRLMTLATPHGGARHSSAAGILRFVPGMSGDDVTYLTPRWVKDHMGGQKPRPEMKHLAEPDVFCLVGTRHEGYYPVARHLPKTDGIVHQEEAYLEGHPYAFVYNTHSGMNGIRENHDAYQTMRRFLFGDLRVRLALQDIELVDKAKYRQDSRFFFHYFVKPRGINAHLNEISERAENQPRPRTLAELRKVVKNGRYQIYDGFADSGAIVRKSERDIPGVVKNTEDLPHFQLEFLSFLYDKWVGGKQIGAGFAMLPLSEGDSTMTLEDGAFKAELLVSVTRR